MNLTTSASTSHPKYNQTFTSTRKSQLDSFGRVINCHYTNLNRADTNWSKYAQLLNDRFQNQDKVKINLFGCSDNSDGYTLVMNLIKELGSKAKKFFPISASDISQEIIKDNNDSKIMLHSKDLEYIKKMGMSSMFERDFNEPVQIMRGIEFFPHKVKPELRDKFEFTVKDITQETQREDFSNQVVSFRNGWAFNTLDNQNEIAKNLSKHSDKNTLVMIGQSDLYKSGASDALQRNGFQGIESDVYTAAETNYPSDLIGTPKTKPVYPEFILFEKRGKHV